jgi:Domain of unknown function (DUF397)
VDWRKSSFSNANGGACVEVASTERAVLVRDTMDRDGGTLGFSAGAWDAFTAGLRGI